MEVPELLLQFHCPSMLFCYTAVNTKLGMGLLLSNLSDGIVVGFTGLFKIHIN